VNGELKISTTVLKIVSQKLQQNGPALPGRSAIACILIRQLPDWFGLQNSPGCIRLLPDEKCKLRVANLYGADDPHEPSGAQSRH
jgi:hypothetical protein